MENKKSMKTKILILLLISIQNIGFTQISVGPEHIGKPKQFKKDRLQKFKETTTVFVFSDVYEKSEYEAILKDAWTVTPYEIVSKDAFDPLVYEKGNYSIANIEGYRVSMVTKSNKTINFLHSYFDFFMYDYPVIKKKVKRLNSNKPKKFKDKLSDIFFEHKFKIARFCLYPNKGFIDIALSKSREEITNNIYTEDVFFNYKPGMLKNYFQKVSDLIDKEEVYWMYEKNEFTQELAELPQATLYIPEYIGMKTNAWTSAIDKQEDNAIIKLYNNYLYKYEFLDDEVLDKKILNKEAFYYLRYVRVNSQKFIEVINAKTGDVIYRNYVPGFSYNMKPKYLKELNKAIKKAVKRKK